VDGTGDLVVNLEAVVAAVGRFRTGGEAVTPRP
jgi:hypothetical protein